jgi:hypothetical protein
MGFETSLRFQILRRAWLKRDMSPPRRLHSTGQPTPATLPREIGAYPISTLSLHENCESGRKSVSDCLNGAGDRI